MNLQKEITKCMEFKSKHEEIDVVSLEEFYKEASPNSKGRSHHLRPSPIDAGTSSLGAGAGAEKTTTE